MDFKEYPVTAAGLTLNCREAGSGLPVVFLESFGWGHQLLYDALAGQFRLFVLELGAGAADTPPEAVRQLAESTAGESYGLVGFSQGANLALRTVMLAPRDPDPVDALVLISPTAVRPAADLASLDSMQWANRLLAHEDSQNGMDGLPQGADLATLISPVESDAGLEARLPQVMCPTLVAFGSRDRMTAREAPSTYRANIPNCHVSLIYDAAHLVAAERPQAVAGVVSDFIENRETFVVNRQRSVINP